MRIRSFATTFCTLGFLLATACGGSSKPIETSEATNTKRPTIAETPESATPKGPRGLDAPGNDPALVALAREAAKCYNEAECEAKSKWYEPFKNGQEVDYKTLVNLIEDQRREIRILAASVLRGKKGQPGFHRDTAYATRVLDALEHEEDDITARRLALVAGLIEVKATGLEDRMVKIMRMDLREGVRVAITESILINNWDVPTITSAVKGMLSDASIDVRTAAIRAFDMRELHDEACGFWASTLIDRDTYLADKCYYFLVSSVCKSQYDEMLRVAEKRPPASPDVFQPLCQQVDGTEPITKRITDDVERWATTTTLSGMQRSQSLKLLATCDPERAKKVAGDLAKDQDENVRRDAAELLKTLDKR